jgi:hypothetical protein
VFPEALESDITANQYLMTSAMKKFEEDQRKNALISLDNTLLMAKNIQCGPLGHTDSVRRLIKDIETHIQEETKKLDAIQNTPQVKQLIQEIDD